MIKENLELISMLLILLVTFLMILMNKFSRNEKYSSSIKLGYLTIPLIISIIVINIILGKTINIVISLLWVFCLSIVIANQYYGYNLLKLQNHLNRAILDKKNLLEIYDIINSSNNKEKTEKARKFFQENYVEYNPNTEELKETPKLNNKE